MKTMRFTYAFVIMIYCLITSTAAMGNESQVFTFSFHDNYTSGYALQYAIWMESTTGDYVQTVFVTRKTARSAIGVKWPFTLPVWAHRHGGDYGGSIYPTSESPLPDAISTASPYGGSIVKTWEPTESLSPGEYYYFIEINMAFDTNDSYTTGNGQPSVVWRGSITIGSGNSTGSAEIIGHGHEDEDDGTIYSDVSLLTTALDYITNVELSYTGPIIPENNPPEITTTSLPDAVEGQPYITVVTATDPDEGDTLTFELLDGPSWLSISSGGTFTGTPLNNDAGSGLAVIIAVTDNPGLADTLATTINVLQVLEPPFNVTVNDALHDHGYRLILNWDVSPDEENGSVSMYKIFRSRSDILTEPLYISQFTSIDSLIAYEKQYTILIDSVSAGNTYYPDESIPLNGVLYYYWLQATGTNGVSEKVAAGYVTEVHSTPSEFKVYSPYPNPFNASTTIKFSIPEAGFIDLVIYNVMGQKMREVVSEYMTPGHHTVVWDGRDDNGISASGGVYITQLRMGKVVSAGRVVLVK